MGLLLGREDLLGVAQDLGRGDELGLPAGGHIQLVEAQHGVAGAAAQEYDGGAVWRGPGRHRPAERVVPRLGKVAEKCHARVLAGGAGWAARQKKGQEQEGRLGHRAS